MSKVEGVLHKQGYLAGKQNLADAHACCPCDLKPSLSPTLGTTLPTCGIP